MKRLAYTLLTLGTFACGGGASSGPEPAAVPGAPPPPAANAQPEDQLFNINETSLTGAYIKPDALAQPEISWTLPGKRTLADQRKVFARAKGANRFSEGDGLAALLWTQGTPEGRAEARKLLADLAKEPGAANDIVEKSGLIELGLGDEPAAAVDFELLGKNLGNNDAGARWMAYAAFIHLRQNENDKARALVADLDATNRPEVAYAQAWVKFRAGDAEGARTKIADAAKAWPDSPSLPHFMREVMLMSARAAADVAPTAEVLARGKSKTDPAIIKLLGGLADAYLYAGEYEKRGGVLEMLGVATPTPDVLAFVYFYQSDVQYRVNHPETAASKLVDAWTLVLTAGDKVPEKTRNDIAGRMFELAAIYHRVYASSYDKRYGEAAKNLFAAYIGVTPPPQFVEDAKGRAKSLGELMGADHAGQGVADKEEIGRRLFARREQLSACYERYLQTEPKLTGKLQLTFDVSENGTVPTVTTSPAGDGPSGMPAVATCVTAKMKGWTFARRGKPGITRVVWPVSFTPNGK
jgi:hypothetical protein